MNYLTYSGNNLLNVELPGDATVLYPRPPLAGIPKAEFPERVRRAVANPLGMPPLRELVNGSSRVLIAFDDNCQPFPPTARPDFRQIVIETLLELLYSCGVEKKNIRLICAVALHRKMKRHELEFMVGEKVMGEFYPHQLDNFDAEDHERLANLGKTDKGEKVEISSHAVEADLIIYVDSVQIPLNGGHKSVGVGLAGYKTIAYHHSPHVNEHTPHLMQPCGSEMHASIERIGRVVESRCRIMVIEFAMNNAIYPPATSYLGKSPGESTLFDKVMRAATPLSMKLMPEPARRKLLRSFPGDYLPVEINAGSVDAVHPLTLEALKRQLEIHVPRQYDTMVFGLPDLSPYAVDARVNPVLVVSDVLGYVLNWFYNKPILRANGSVIILNPLDEVFHPEYHAAYRRFFDEVLPVTSDPFEMQRQFQEKFAFDPELIDAYRNRYAHHGFHPFTVWYWATYPLRHLKHVIVVGPKDDRVAKRLGVKWAPSMAAALEMTGGPKQDIVALTIPPFFYVSVA